MTERTHVPRCPGFRWKLEPSYVWKIKYPRFSLSLPLKSSRVGEVHGCLISFTHFYQYLAQWTYDDKIICSSEKFIVWIEIARTDIIEVVKVCRRETDAVAAIMCPLYSRQNLLQPLQCIAMQTLDCSWQVLIKHIHLCIFTRIKRVQEHTNVLTNAQNAVIPRVPISRCVSHNWTQKDQAVCRNTGIQCVCVCSWFALPGAYLPRVHYRVCIALCALPCVCQGRIDAACRHCFPDYQCKGMHKIQTYKAMHKRDEAMHKIQCKAQNAQMHYANIVFHSAHSVPHTAKSLHKKCHNS